MTTPRALLLFMVCASAGCQSWIRVEGQIYAPTDVQGFALIDDEPLPSLVDQGCRPLSGVSVTLFAPGNQTEEAVRAASIVVPDARTNASGRFSIRKLDEGEREFFGALRFEKAGYKTVVRVFWVDDRDDRPFNVVVLMVPDEPGLEKPRNPYLPGLHVELEAP